MGISFFVSTRATRHRSRGGRWLVFTAACCLIPVSALAGPWSTKTAADVRARGAMIGTGAMDVGRPLASDDGSVAADQVLETRLRLGGSVAWQRGDGFVRAITVHVQGDLFTGPQWADGHSPLLRYDPLEIRPARVTQQTQLRRAFISLDTTIGRLAVGRTLSTWGLGLLAQSGDPDPYQFGIKRTGTIVDRAQVAFAPFLRLNGPRPRGTPLFVSFAADHVVADDLAMASDGDKAYNFIGAVLYRGAAVQAGGYLVVRRQNNTAGGADLRIDANAYDIYARWAGAVAGWQVDAATEWLMLRGETTYFRTTSNPDLLKIAQFGGVVRVTATRDALGVRLESGLTSADDRPFDDTLSNLKFSREYRVGLAMFHQGLRRTTATMAANLADPRYVGQAPAGFERAATGGSVSGAIYVMPTVRYQLLQKRLTLLGGLLWAQGSAPLVDAYQSGLKGGDAIGPRGGKASTDLGYELDFATSWRQPIGSHFAVLARGDVGRWTPGAAFDDAAGAAAAPLLVWMGRLELQGSW